MVHENKDPNLKALSNEIDYLNTKNNQRKMKKF